jgi:hypothetical protein
MDSGCTCVGDKEKHADPLQSTWPKHDWRETPHIAIVRTEDVEIGFQCITLYAIVAALIYLHLISRSPRNPRLETVQGIAWMESVALGYTLQYIPRVSSTSLCLSLENAAENRCICIQR